MAYSKFIVAFIGAAVSVGIRMLSDKYGIDLSGHEADIVDGVTGFATAALVYLVPNKSA
jgi:hypothetical protein